MSQLFSEYYASIRRVRAELAGQFPSGDCLITSKGCVCEAPVPLAATLLVAGTHALASKAEQDAFHATMEMNRVSTPQTDTLANARAQYAILMAARKVSTHESA